MTPRSFRLAVCLLALSSASALFGQAVSSSILGTVVDPAGSIVPDARIVVTNTGTANINNTLTDNSGFFRVANILQGSYAVKVEATGFKALTITEIELGASEVRDLGKLVLALGNVTDSISVTGEIAAVQTATSDRSALVDATQFNTMAIKGRDMMSYMKLLPGVIDTTTGRDAAGGTPLGGLTFSGNTGIIGFSVDGATDMDTGCSNCFTHFEPNIDSIAEIKVMVSNFAAEFGRNSGATISVTTKSGTQEFHGSGWWTHRHEGLNSNAFFNNQTGLPVSRYRYNIAGFSVGGPVFIPKLFNQDKTKVFFFASQEYTRQLVNGANQYRSMPTQLERDGDFSQSILQSGAKIIVKDPLNNGVQFPNNVIPKDRINGWGLSMLNFFPLPNASFAPGTAQFQANNFQSAGASKHPRRNDIFRVDVNATPKLSGYFRYGHDKDDLDTIYKGIQFLKSVQLHPTPGAGYVTTINYTFTPTLVNQATYNFSYNFFAYLAANPAEIARSLADGATGTPQAGQALPSLLPLHTPGPGPGGEMLQGPCKCSNGYARFLPQMNFGNIPPNTASFNASDIDYANTNRIKQFSDNLTWIKGRHTIKAGIYAEYNRKLQPGNTSYLGNYDFGTNSSNPLDSGNGYANALLGNFNTYSENSGHFVYDVRYWNTEFYVQDDWRIGKRVTLNFGVRFYHVSPQIDLNNEFSYLDVSRYDRKAVPRIYAPFCKNGTNPCTGTNRIGIDPGTGTQVPAAYIGLFVPGTGNTANGMVVDGVGGAPLDTYTNRYIAPAPRIGFAWDIFGDGKTALRGGWGMFYDRLDGNQVYNMSGQPPVGYQPTAYYGNISNLATLGGLFGPQTINQWNGHTPIPQNRSASLSVQRNLGWGTVVDVAYQGTFGVNRPFRVNLNPVPLYSGWGTYQDLTQPPTSNNQPARLPSSLSRVNYPGYGDVNQQQFGAKSRYDGLQISMKKAPTHGLIFGFSYAWSHSFSVTSFDPLVADNYQRNWGPQNSDRRHVGSFYYAYDIPKLGKKLNSRPLGIVTDGWNFSGITGFSTGSPFTPSFSTTNNLDFTGSPNINPRIDVVGDPYQNLPASNPSLPHGRVFFNPAAFARPAVGSIGSAGNNIMYGPAYINHDVTLNRRIPLGKSERRELQLKVEAFNVLNHPQFTGVNSSFTFNAAGVNSNANIGALTGERGPRIISLEVRVHF
ncbi:MAG: carboxypeptidase-like regulatory domain-containing protein [Candidatus Solibacter sp.]